MSERTAHGHLRARTPAWTVAAAAISAAAVLAGVASIPLGVLLGEAALHPFVTGGATLGISFGIVGGLIAVRRPQNAIAWLFLLVAVSQSATTLTGLYAELVLLRGFALPGYEVALWASSWAWAPGFITLVTLVPLLFPTGRPPSARWRPLVALGALAIATVVLVTAASTWSDPLGAYTGTVAPDAMVQRVLDGAMLLVGVIAVGALVGLVQRFRHADPTVRAQLKWFVSAAIAEVAVLLGVAVLGGFDWWSGSEWMFATLMPFALPALPVAVGIAVLRYRLYEIDRLISRTVSYAGVTLLLVTVYVVSVFGLGAVVRGLTRGGGDLVVAASTLLVAAAFGPVRRRVRSAVDRRFARARYDAVRTVEAFGQRLRHETDVEILADELVDVLRGAVRPRHVAVWLLPGTRS